MAMTRIAVTGGSGKLGRAVVADLLAHGNEVVNLDIAAPRPHLKIDLTDYGQTVEALTRIDDRYDRIDAVVHLAAIPAPGLLPNATTFQQNITATYNVFSAARLAGITNVVWASRSPRRRRTFRSTRATRPGPSRRTPWSSTSKSRWRSSSADGSRS
jgi:nucleoside-diphosphate-sugar epimerase